MKHFKIFNTASDYYAYKESSDYIIPNISVLRDSSDIWINGIEHDYEDDYFTIESLENDNTVIVSRYYTENNNGSTISLQYSTDDGETWSTLSMPAETQDYNVATLDKGEKVMFKNDGLISTSESAYTSFNSTKGINACGNVVSLTSGSDFKGGQYGNYQFCNLFSGCTTLVSVKNLCLAVGQLKEKSFLMAFKGCTSLINLPKLPNVTLANECYQYAFMGCTSLPRIPSDYLMSTSLARGCYYGMFRDCTSLVSGTALPSSALTENCYKEMFKGCTSLTVAPELPATAITTSSYCSMFEGCTSLVNAPELPATRMNNMQGYRDMFKDCTSLVVAPEINLTYIHGGSNLQGMFYGCTALTTPPPVLPATSGAGRMYRGMFQECKSLNATPEIKLETVPTLCCEEMFKNCTSLTTPPVLSATTLSEGCYQGMFQGCTSLTVAPVLSATTLAKNCYKSMFQGCTSLTATPVLSATTLSVGCYDGMFQECFSLTVITVLPSTTLPDYCYRTMFKNCKSLVTTPVLSATVMGTECYREMFQDCTSLTTAQGTIGISSTTMTVSACTSMFKNCSKLTTVPSLPATTMGSGCYWSMFEGCTSLASAPELPSTTLAQNCYRSMFAFCTSLTTAPDLMSTTLADGCYWSMFWKANNLSYIKMLAIDTTTPTNALTDWVNGVQTNSGTFVKNVNNNSLSRGVHGIPNGWNVIDYSDVNVSSVTISSTAETITKGETTTLVATVLPSDAFDKSVTWASSDSTVATVSSGGVVTAVGCGNATITVTTTDGGYTAQCTTTVENPVTSVTLNTNVLTILTASTYQLEATVSPSDACGDKSVSWASSNSNIATVSNNGLVTAVSVGSAVITATTTVGSHTATCAVEVSEPVAVTGVTLDANTFNLTVNQTRQLVATVLPSNAADKSVTWSSDDTSVATVDSNGVVSGVTTGSATITVTTVDGGYTAQSTVTVSEPTFTTIAIEGASVVSAETCQYRAICDNIEDVTSSATWSITAGSQYAIINSSNGQVTILNGASESSVTIQAEYDGLTATTVVTFTYVSGATSETTSETTTDVGGNATTVVTTVTEYEDGSSIETVETVVTDANGDLVGTSESSKTTNADGSYNGTTTNYDGNGDPVNGSNVTGDTEGNVSTQSVEYDDSGNTVVTGYDIDTSESESGKTFNHDGVNTDYYAFDVTHGFTLDFDFTIDFSNQPSGQENNQHNVLTAKRATPEPWYGFQLRHSSTNKVVQLGTQFSTGDNTNTDLSPSLLDGNVGTYKLRITYDPTSTGKTFTCVDTYNQAERYYSTKVFPDLDELKYLKIVIGYAVNASGNPMRYSNITVSKFELKKLKHVANPTITYDGDDVTISCSTVGASIYYRLNLSGDYSAYTASFAITSYTVVQAYATYSGDTSDIVREDFDLINVTSVTLSDNSVTIGEFKTYTLSATVLPSNALNKNVTWSSSNSGVASVDSNGVVSGVTTGSATITVTTVDGGYTAQCEVSVNSDYSMMYFTIQSLEDNNEIHIRRNITSNTEYYSIDNGTTWSAMTSGSGDKTIATLNSGDTMLIKCTTNAWAINYNNYNHLYSTKNIQVYGNIMSLTYGDDFATATTLGNTALAGLFFGSTSATGGTNTKIVSAENLVLPATEVGISTYNGMFRGCTNLVNGPKLLPATTLYQDTYSSMFEGCTSLVEAPVICATTLNGTTAMGRMFCMNRNSKVTAAMTKGPVLPATTLGNSSYKEMFKGNGSLNEITLYATSLGSNGLQDWVANVGNGSGTFYKNPNMTSLPTSNSGIPSGWTVKDISA